MCSLEHLIKSSGAGENVELWLICVSTLSDEDLHVAETNYMLSPEYLTEYLGTANKKRLYVNMLSALYICTDYLGNQGRRAVFSCNPPSDAYDVRSIDWKHDGRPLTIQGPKHEKMANRLIITNIEPSDEGMYSCVVTDDSNTQTEVEVSCLFILGESVKECMSGHT